MNSNQADLFPGLAEARKPARDLVVGEVIVCEDGLPGIVTVARLNRWGDIVIEVGGEYGDDVFVFAPADRVEMHTTTSDGGAHQ